MGSKLQTQLTCCAIKDASSGRNVGYSIDSRMKSRLAVQALENAVAMRGDVAGCIVHSDRGSQFRSRKFLRALARHRMVGSMGRVGSSPIPIIAGTMRRASQLISVPGSAPLTDRSDIRPRVGQLNRPINAHVREVAQLLPPPTSPTLDSTTTPQRFAA